MLINIYAILCVVHMSSKRWVIIPFRRAFAKYLICDMLNQFESIISIDTMRFKKGACYTITLHIICLFGFLSNVHSEHENLWSHSRHFVIETVSVNTIHMGCKRIFSIWFSVSLVDDFSIRSINLQFQEYCFSTM